jgi:hypothetical protein
MDKKRTLNYWTVQKENVHHAPKKQRWHGYIGKMVALSCPLLIKVQ